MATQNDMPTKREKQLLMHIDALKKRTMALEVSCEGVSKEYNKLELKYSKLMNEKEKLHNENFKLCRERDIEHTRSHTAYLRYRYEHWHMTMLDKMIHRMIEGVANESFISISTDEQINELFKI